MSTDTNNISLSELEQAKNNLVSHNDEIIKKGFIGDLKRFSLNVMLEIPILMNAYKIQCSLRHLAKNSNRHIDEIKKAAGGDKNYIKNLTSDNLEDMDTINFGGGKGYLPMQEVRTTSVGSQFSKTTKNYWVQYWEDCWSRITKVVCLIVAAGMVLREEKLDIEAQIILNKLKLEEELKFQFLKNKFVEPKESINEILMGIIDGVWVWNSKNKAKYKSLKDYVITKSGENKYRPINYFTSQLSKYIFFFRNIPSDKINVALNKILSRTLMHATMNSGDPEDFDITEFKGNLFAEPLTEDALIITEAYDYVSSKGFQNAESYDKIKDSTDELFHILGSHSPPSASALRGALNPIAIAYGLRDAKGKFLGGKDMREFLLNKLKEETISVKKKS
jgi:hypothetical protein